MVTAERLKRLAPTARADLVAAIVRNWHLAEAAGITTPLRTVHFLSQTATETGGFRAIEENLNYSAKRLVQVWPARFPNIAAAKPFAGNPKALANKTYGGRLGNTQPGDGWRYRGGGFIQTTGRENYRKAGFEDNPEALRDPDAGFAAALTFWTDNRCNAIADRDDVAALRKRINGGSHGLAECKEYLAQARGIFTGPAPTRPQSTSAHRQSTPAAPAPQPAAMPAGKTAPGISVIAVQRTLKALGYHDVGIIDDQAGGATYGAVTAFRLDRSMAPGGIDQALVDELGRATVEGWSRPITAERAEASNVEVQQRAPEAKAAATSSLWTGLQAFGASIFAAVAGAFDNVGWAKEALGPLRDLISDVPPWVWAALVGVVSYAAWRKSRQAEEATVQAYRTGERK